MGSANLAFTIMAGPLMDRVGRRPMLIASYSGMAACLFSVSFLDAMFKQDPSSPVSPTAEKVGLATAGLLILYVLFFALGAGPVTWICLSEILPPNIKGKAAALATFLCWVCNLVVALTFSPMLKSLGVGGSYLIYATFNVVAFVWLHFNMVETKCRSLREIEALLCLPRPAYGQDASHDTSQGNTRHGPGSSLAGNSNASSVAMLTSLDAAQPFSDTGYSKALGIRPVYRSEHDPLPASSLPEQDRHLSRVPQ
eukprot:gene2973-12980_t